MTDDARKKAEAFIRKHLAEGHLINKRVELERQLKESRKERDRLIAEVAALRDAAKLKEARALMRKTEAVNARGRRLASKLDSPAR